MWVNVLLRMFSRWPSSGGFSSSMDWVSPTAIWAMASVVSATGPPSPMFSPAAVQCTPAAVSRAPSAASPGHWWDSPQPAAIRWLCADELAPRPVVTVSAGSPAAERAWLISASTCAAAVPPWLGGELAWDGVVTDADGWALAGRGDGEREDADADGLVPAGRDGTDATTGGPPVARPAQVPVAAAPHPDAVA